MENGVRPLLKHSILTFSGLGMWVQTKKWGFSNQHGLKNELPAPIAEAYIGECGTSMEILMVQCQQIPE